MIQKRYQFYSSKGKKWTTWRDFSENDSLLLKLQKEDKWQLKPQLLNQFRIKPS